MGSTGLGNFSDYPSSRPTNGKNNGGASGEDKCNKAFIAHLEDVQRCQFYTQNNGVPELETEVSIIFNGRLVAVDSEGVEIGYLPTRFNYIRACLDSGINYSGVVSRAIDDVLASVSVDVAPV